MDYFLVSISALVVAALTLFSGFGLGTLLMPVFAIFFPVELAIAVTAVVHLANNIFKLILVGRRADFGVVARFAVPAAAFAFVGALLLVRLAGIAPWLTYELGGRACAVTPVKLVIALLIFAFALIELVPRLSRFSLDRRYLPFGGALSGFFGGLSGHQGALRTIFLSRLGLAKEAFVGTIVVSAVIVDAVRILVYGLTFVGGDLSKLSGQGAGGLVVAGIAAAFVGSFIGSRLLKKITMRTIHLLIGVMLLAFSLALGAGIL